MARSKLSRFASDFALVGLFGVAAYFATKKGLEVLNESVWNADTNLYQLGSMKTGRKGVSRPLVGFVGTGALSKLAGRSERSQ